MAEIVQELPNSIDAEQCVIASILSNTDLLSEISRSLDSEDFFYARHKDMYEAIKRLFLKNSKIDIVTLSAELSTEKSFQSEDPINYIKAIAEKLPTSTNYKDYVDIVKERALKRRIIELSNEIKSQAYTGENASSIVEYAENEVYNLTKGKTSNNLVPISTVLANTFNHLSEISKDPGVNAGTPTNFKPVDDLLVGMGKGDMILIGARPGMGKTSFALNIATNVAKNTKKAVCIFSLEMSAEQLVTRLIASEAMIDSRKLRSGEISPDEWGDISNVCAELATTNILIDDTAGITVSQIRSKVNRVKDLGLIVIDYLQLLQGERHSDNRVLEVGDISRNIKLMAKELEIPIICCAQLSRANEKRNNGDRRPVLSDLRDSGSIEQDADAVMFLYRNEESMNDTAGRGEVECIFAKNRHGSTGIVKLGWYGQYTKFINIEQTHDEPV
ncbi:MAG: replicative DNA helicase [Clostridia bacterium]|nr:replicative DNA helicase [Clostridia bacterium]